jgi:hypothetical protein
VLLWDRKTQGGFPETKVLKQLLRDHLQPQRDLGHSDRGGKKKAAVSSTDVPSSAVASIPELSTDVSSTAEAVKRGLDSEGNGGVRLGEEVVAKEGQSKVIRNGAEEGNKGEVVVACEDCQ